MKKRIKISFSEAIIATAERENISLLPFRKKYVLSDDNTAEYLFGLDIQKGCKPFGVVIKESKLGWTEVVRNVKF